MFADNTSDARRVRSFWWQLWSSWRCPPRICNGREREHAVLVWQRDRVLTDKSVKLKVLMRTGAVEWGFWRSLGATWIRASENGLTGGNESFKTNDQLYLSPLRCPWAKWREAFLPTGEALLPRLQEKPWQQQQRWHWLDSIEKKGREPYFTGGMLQQPTRQLRDRNSQKIYANK